MWSWTIKKAECRRIDASELCCWRRLLRVAWTARRSNQWFLKEISPEYSLEGLMLKLKLQYFGHLKGRTDSVEKTLMLGKIEGKRRRGWQRMGWLLWYHQLYGWYHHRVISPTLWTWVWVSPGVGDEQGSLECCSLWGCKESDMTEWLNWTDWGSTNYSIRNVTRNTANIFITINGV